MFNENVSKSGVVAFYLKPREKKKKTSEEVIEFEYCDSKEFGNTPKYNFVNL